MIKSILASALIAGTAICAVAQDYSTMYLIKGDRIVGKYNVDDVDYATFTLPEGIVDQSIDLNVDEVGKNFVTYTVRTINPMTMYAHGLVSEWDAEYMALDLEGTSFAELAPEMQTLVLKYCLQNCGYMAAGEQQFTQRDFADDGDNGRLSVIPGTHYYLCGWELNSSYEPLETFVYKELDTLEPGQSAATSTFTYLGPNAQGVGFTPSFSGDVLYVTTLWGLKDVLDLYINETSLDTAIGLFGQSWSPDELTGEYQPGVPNATWPTNGSGDYVLYVRTYDSNGDKSDSVTDVSYTEQGSEVQGPEIKILTKEKSEGHVSVTFEITPSNVEEAYVRLLDENTVDDRLNSGYELHEIAMGGDAEDITNIINTQGEYTYTRDDVSDSWQTILVYAKDKDGHRTTLRINFNTTAGNWAIYDPVSAAPARKLPAFKAFKSKHDKSIRRAF